MEDAPPLPPKPGDGVEIKARRPHFLRNDGGAPPIVSTYILEKGQPSAILA